MQKMHTKSAKKCTHKIQKNAHKKNSLLNTQKMQKKCTQTMQKMHTNNAKKRFIVSKRFLPGGGEVISYW
jgi:hypothetical protein